MIWNKSEGDSSQIKEKVKQKNLKILFQKYHFEILEFLKY